MALSQQQINFNRLPYEEQQKQIQASYMNTGMQGRDAFDTLALQKDATAQRNTPAQRVNEAIQATTSVTPSVPQNNNANTSTSPAQVVNNANNNVPKVNPVDTFKRESQQNVDTYKSSVAPNNYSTYEKNETARREAEAEAIRARVRAAIQQGVSEQEKIISNAPQQFVNPMNNADFQGAKNARAIDERMAAMGLGRSGANISAQTSNANQTQANINDLENTKAKVISDANAAIANLRASGSLEEVRLVQEAAAKSLERLQAQQNLIEGRQNEQALAIFNNANNALKTSYDIGANEKQLGMQERQLGANITGVDPFTGRSTAASEQFNKTFGLNEAGVTGNYGGNRTIQGQELDNSIANTKFNQGIATAGITGNYNGARTLQGKQVDSALQTDELQRAALEIDNKIKNYNLDKLMPLEYDRAKQLIDIGRVDLAIKEFENTNAPEKFKMEMAKAAESINASQQQTAQNWATTTYNTNKPYYKPESGSDGNISSKEVTARTTQYSKAIQDNYYKDGKPDKLGITNAITELIDSGEDKDVVDNLARKFNITAQDIINLPKNNIKNDMINRSKRSEISSYKTITNVE